jgi:hypothetical protein
MTRNEIGFLVAGRAGIQRKDISNNNPGFPPEEQLKTAL